MPLDGGAVERLRREMNLRGWNITALARHADVSQPTISKLLARRRVAPETMRKIAQAFEEHPPSAMLERLLGGEG